ncbi:MAG: 2-amino-4-hydroxy-6-hydroxymethyldihydropteridine diphosphokinase [Methylococcaceae bacterium]|nr:2-amino-4-hydroxy-6-hydroxymethyldihydropteridine diphosphokinase [Methylococcaceae bacterium]
MNAAAVKMPQVWLSIGSNMDRERSICGAVKSLRDAFGELVLSSVYESKAVGFDGDPFYNMVAGLGTALSARSLNGRLREIEERHGRVRGGVKFSSRTLDIDLLLYGNAVINEGEIEIPRNEIMQYAFVLLPLAEVAGELKHPVNGCTYQKLWDAFDPGQQRLWRVELNLKPLAAQQ